MQHTRGLWSEEAFDDSHVVLDSDAIQRKTRPSPWEKEYAEPLLGHPALAE